MYLINVLLCIFSKSTPRYLHKDWDRNGRIPVWNNSDVDCFQMQGAEEDRVSHTVMGVFCG